jgi:hypothetical protein
MIYLCILYSTKEIIVIKIKKISIKITKLPKSLLKVILRKEEINVYYNNNPQ